MSEADGIREESCSSIRKNQVPQPSTDTNDIILKMLEAIAQGMDQNVGALHATNGMLDNDANATQGGRGSLWLLAALWGGGLVTLARLPRREGNLRTSVIRFHTSIAEIDTNIPVGTPLQLRWQRVLQHESVVMMPPEGATKNNPQLVRERHDRVLQRMRFFSAVRLPLLRLIWRTMLRPFGGSNEPAIHPWPGRLHRLRRRERAGRHQRELRQVFVGFRPRHRTRRAQNITGGIRGRIGENTRSLLHHRGPCPFGPTPRATPAGAGWAPCFIRVGLGGSVESTADGPQRVALGLGQAGQGLPLTLVSDLPPHR